MTKRSKPLISVFLALTLSAALVPAASSSALADTENEALSADSPATDADATDSAAAQETNGADPTPPRPPMTAAIL